jgi:hypothetical protein
MTFRVIHGVISQKIELFCRRGFFLFVMGVEGEENNCV